MVKLRHIALELLAVGLIVVGLIVWQIGPDKIGNVFAKANLIALGLFALVSVMLALALTLKWRLILDAQNLHVPFWRLVAYRFVGYSVSYLTPTMHVGSEPVRAYLLKREGIPGTVSFSNVIIDKSIELLSDTAFFFIGALIVLGSVAISPQTKIFALCVAIFLLALVGAFIAGVLGETSMFVAIFRFLRLNRIKRLANVEKNLAEVEEQIEIFYRTKRKYFLGIVLVMLGIWVLMYFEYKFALLTFGIDASLAQIFLILTGVGLAYSIPVPAAMGTLELGQLAAAKVLSLSAVAGISLALLIRLRDLIWTIFGLGYVLIYHFSFKRLANKAQEVEEDFSGGDLFRRRT